MAQKPTYEELEQRFKKLGKGPDEKARFEDRLQVLSLAIDQSSEGIAVVDLDGNLEYLNASFAIMHGYSPEELIGKNLSIFHSPEQLPSVDAANRQLKETENFIGEIWHIRRDGTEFPTLMHNSLINNVEGKPIGMLGTIRDISDMKQAEEALRKSEEKLILLLENLSDLVLILDKDGINLWNSNSVRQYGIAPDASYGISAFHYVHPEDKDNALAVFKKAIANPGVSFVSKHRATATPDNPELWIHQEVTFKYLPDKPLINGVIAVCRDVTERNKAEEYRIKLQGQLQQAQKMESIGTLAGGIAHDFNNLLTAIIGYAELSEMKLPEDSDIHHDLAEILIAGERAKELVKQILTFSRHEESRLVPILIDPIVKEAIKLIRSSIPTTIEIKKNIEKCGTIMADPTQIHQVIMNLCTNAYHAMEDKGGIIEVALNEVNISSADAALYHDLKPGPYVMLSISDTGQGMTREVMGRIFEPYFTTKKHGKGTGLGLAVVHGIIKNHKGAIKVYSELSKGSAFQVYLPLIKKELTEVEKIDKKLFGGKETILFIDDEKPIANLGKKILEKLGYRVESKTNSLEAIELFRSNPEKFDLVITDMTMPEITGDVLADKLMEIRPDIPVILCTGFSEKINEQKALKKGIKRLLMKPLSSRDLTKTIRKVLDGR